MKEDFLHYVWRYKLFSSDKLRTTKGERITVLKTGEPNVNAGPDFLNAQLLIKGQKWVGNIEIHLKSSDWYVHHHEKDRNYDAVILHVVYEDDAKVFMKNNEPLPTLEMNNKIPKVTLENYQKLFSKNKQWILCEKDIATIDSFLFDNWLERLYVERLEEKAVFILDLLKNSENNYEAVLFQLLAKNFGLKVNADAFLSLAQSVDFSIVRKERFEEEKLSSLLFGVAGFLEEDFENVYYKQLKKEYEYMQHKYKLKSMPKNQFQFFRMRPQNFPTIRIAQLVALYVKHQNLFSKLKTIQEIADCYDLFSVEVANFWKNHYTFETESKKSPKKLTQSFIHLIVINTIVPLLFVYHKYDRKGQETALLKLIKELPSEKNSIISKFSEYKIIAKNAYESQALLQLKSNYCDAKKCLSCSIGSSLINV